MNAWRVVELLGVIAEESRYGIIAMLVQAGEDGMPQNRILSRSGLQLPRLKRHLAKLVKAGLVRRNHRRKGIVWKIDERQIGDLIATLTLRLQPPLLGKASKVIAIEPPKGFRSLASKLRSVTPSAATEDKEHRRRLAKPASGRRPLPARLTEAIANQAAGAANNRMEPAQADAPNQLRQAQEPPRLASPAPPAEPAPDDRPSRKRRYPLRLSDAIAETAG